MADIERIIREELEDPRAVFVFHNEVTARFWLRRAFRFTRRRTLPEDRFIAWDRFRKRTLRYPASRREADKPFRTLFLAGLLQENRRTGRFRRLIPPEHRSNSMAFLRSLRKVLPGLHRVHEIGEGVLSEEKRADLHLLLQRYREHLARAGRYEPAYEQPAFKPGPWKYRILHPQIIQEWPAYSAILAPHPQVRVEPADFSRSPLEAGLEAFAATPEEITAVLLQVGRLLDEGTEPQEIVLTVASLEAVEPTLRVLARRHEVPLSFHHRKPVGRYPAGRLFRGIADLADSGFSLESMKALLLNQALPWREEKRARDLVRFGVEQRVLRNYALRGADRDLWAQALERCLSSARRDGSHPQAAHLQGLRDFYRGLREGVERIAGAAGFGELQERLEKFADGWLDKTRWNEESTRVYQFALNTLKELIAAGTAEERLDSPFALWLEYLEDREYVPREEEARVQVYPYPVTAGIRPAYHFILNASQEGTRQIIERYPFLSLQEQPLDARQVDLSDICLRIYCLSGGQVRFSFSRATPQGEQLPASFFLAGGRITAASPSPADGYELERRLWRTAPPAPAAPAPPAPLPRLYPRQRAGLRRALATGLRPKESDLTARRLADGQLLQRIRERLTATADGLQALSPTQLEAYLGCPFQYLFQRVLGIEEAEYTPVMWDAREFGRILHQVFHRFYRQRLGRPLRPEQLDGYRRRIREEAEAVLAEYELDHPLPVAPIWEEIARRVIALSEAFIQEEMRELPGQEVLETELAVDLPLPEEGVRLTGTIDRLSRHDGRVGLIDYKKRTVPGKADIFGEEPSSFQIPFYLLLLTRAGWKPEWAAYYSIEDRQYRFVFHPQKPRPYAGREEVEQAVSAVEQRIRQAIRGIREGEFRPADRSEKLACPYCPMRGLCRGRFVSWE